MIVVVADDLSGAAELAGIAFAHGLTAEVQTEFIAQTDAEVICLDINTRLLPPDQAAAKIRKLSKRIVAAKPDWIYKKTDSALRGNIAAEITALLQATAQGGSVFVPANPSRGRVIRGGQYFIDDTPLHETDFAADPHHPATSASFANAIGHDPAIAIPNAQGATDLQTAARDCDDRVLPAGAGDFFAANLEVRGHEQMPVEVPPMSGPALFVCGSMAAWGRQRAGHCGAHGVPVCAMPAELLGQTNHTAALHEWVRAACTALGESGACMLAIGRVKTVNHPPLLEERLAQAMAMVLAQVEVERLMLEGGATASAALRRMLWMRLRVTELAAPDLPGLRVADADGPRIFMKPGSYDWPETAWDRGLNRLR